jgi:hypothetical protein
VLAFVDVWTQNQIQIIIKHKAIMEAKACIVYILYITATKKLKDNFFYLFVEALKKCHCLKKIPIIPEAVIETI